MPAALRVTEDIFDQPPEDPAEVHKRLMARVAADRDREAFRDLFVHFGPRVKALMMRGGANPEHAEDLMQDVMMTVWRKVELYGPERGSVSAWIFAIARNARIDALRRGSSRPYQDIDDIELASDEADGEDHVYAGQRAERVAVALGELPDEQREIIELAYVHDLPQSAIAERLGIPLGTVKSRMRLAYAKLKTSLGEFQ
jgi:RNA polymerase sigma-70 factor (ECF subfamily)